MNDRQKKALMQRDTDINGVLHRFCNDEELYIMCLREFLDDPTVTELKSSVRLERWDDAFTAAHALKGLAGNLGFVPLMHAAGQLVVLIRGGRISGISAEILILESCYRDITDAIREVLAAAE